MCPEKTIIRKDIRTPMFSEALFTIAKIWKQSKCPLTEEWIKRMWYIYTTKYCYCHLYSLSHVQLFWNPMDYSLPGSAIHGMSQARILQWVTISFSGESFKSRDQTCISHKQTLFMTEPHWKHNGILLSHKKEWNKAICNNMDGPILSH